MTLERFFFNGLMFGEGIGLTWLYAWMFNPNLTSGSVWFVAFLFGFVFADVSELKMYGKRERK